MSTQNIEQPPSASNPEAQTPIASTGRPSGPGQLTDAELETRFRYQRPDMAKAQLHAQVTELTLALAKQLRDLCPNGRNLSLALTHLEDTRMRANAAIACGG